MDRASNSNVGPTRRTTCFNGHDVAYYSFGVGPEALVFIHGWTCSSILWRQAGDSLLRRHHRSLLIDLPGHGESYADKPDHLEKTEYGQEVFARSVKAVLDNAGVTRAVLVGHSMGGPVSTMVLRLFTPVVQGIIYVDSFFHSPETYMSGTERRELAKKLQRDSDFEAMINNRFWTERTNQESRTKITETMMATRLYVRVNAVTTDSLPHAFRFDEIYRVPALLIATPERANIDPHWLHHMPELKISVWEDHGHFLFMEDPERFAAEVEGFLVEHNFCCL
ncbi:uncharacterized protein Z520_07701 [Fonsecaea multimorphosa CBS 102226]|uniref:AB hydrolase-1 domain-containing protein n=1 Tax=Fonsecaea multimorphosa CBS 102226 TaxID=1442371 RepID=A0A0D2H3N6_9EURO|nr:uncharacterized protein Z520_07701 [Fonsecaea multimorphosa CBS 102226]KIX96435.1 hypothetical protein Z520_07701 [Fonsecaea multimorphosa CBS 102226]OAL22346.1 hypothetical protein AYO22_07390 [Fonsecaea multimorphosa]